MTHGVVHARETDGWPSEIETAMPKLHLKDAKHWCRMNLDTFKRPRTVSQTVVPEDEKRLLCIAGGLVPSQFLLTALLLACLTALVMSKALEYGDHKINYG